MFDPPKASSVNVFLFIPRQGGLGTVNISLSAYFVPSPVKRKAGGGGGEEAGKEGCRTHSLKQCKEPGAPWAQQVRGGREALGKGAVLWVLELFRACLQDCEPLRSGSLGGPIFSVSSGKPE